MTIRETIEKLEEIDGRINPPSNLEAITKLEKELDFQFPESFKKFYLHFDGFEDSEMTDNMVTLYSINYIRERISKKTIPSNEIPIGDYCIWCYEYGYIKGKEGIYIFTDYSKIADTYDEFLELIIKDSELLY